MFQFIAVTTLFATVTLGNALSVQEAKEYPAFPAHSGKIINGIEMPITFVPWLVRLTHVYENETATYTGGKCGGSIISQNWVLTAAHCVFYNNKTENLVNVIRAGAADYRDGSPHQIAEKIHHPLYEFVEKTNTTLNDIALVRVVQPFIYDLTRKPVPLYVRAKWTLDQSSAVICGWGSIEPEGEGGWPRNLNAALVRIQTTYECNSYLSWAYNSKTVPDGQICGYWAGQTPASARSTCNGDSGGPVTVNGVLVGVVSWGSKPCAGQGHPGVYTEVALHRYWISEVTGV